MFIFNYKYRNRCKNSEGFWLVTPLQFVRYNKQIIWVKFSHNNSPPLSASWKIANEYWFYGFFSSNLI